MMSGAVLRTLAVRISANTAQFRKDIDKVDRRFRRFSSGMRREAMMFQGQMAALGATVASGFGVAEVARAADEMVNLRNKMGATFDTSREVANGMLDIKRIAKESRSELDAVGTLYQRIAVSTKSLGTSQEDVAKVTQVVANSFLMSGTTASEAANSARQFAQGLASGTLRGDEFRSVSENNVVLTQMLAEGLGMTVGQLRLFAQEGGLTAETIIPILTEGLDGTNNAVAKMSLTLGQAKVLFRNAFVEMVDRLNQTFNLVPKVSQAIGVLAKNVHIVTLALAGMATLLLGRLLVGMTAFTVMTIAGAVVGLGKFAYAILFAAVQITTFMVPAIITLTQRIMVLAGVAIAGLIKGIVAMSVALMTTPIGWFIGALAALGAAVTVALQFDIIKRFGMAWQGLKDVMGGFVDATVDKLKVIPRAFEELLNGMRSKYADFLDFIGSDERAAKLRAAITTPSNEQSAEGFGAGARMSGGVAQIMAAFTDPSVDGMTFAEAVKNAKDGAMGLLGTAKDELMSGAGAAMDALPDFANLQQGFAEFVSGVGTQALDAIPGFRAFWAALRGDIDPDAAVAGPAPEKTDVQMSWAERWQLAIAKVKEAFGTLSMAVKGRVNAMKQSYETFDGVLQAGAKSSRKIAALNKALMLKEAFVAQKAAIIKAYNSAPFPANLPGVALVAAQTGLLLRDIIKGQAHDGMDSLPSTGTYMLERGERVVSSRANRDLTEFLAQSNRGNMQSAPLTLQINGVADPDLVFTALEQRRGELTDMIRSISDENLVAPSF